MHTFGCMRSIAVIGMLVVGGSLHAQGLRVRVVDQDSGEPIPVALVTLLREGQEFGEALTRFDGTRFFPADPSARYSLRVRRAGHETFTSDRFSVPDDTTAVRIAVPARRLDLRANRATQRECRADRFDTGVRRLWEQAHTVMRAADIARAEGLEAIAVRRVERTYDRAGTARDENILDGRSLGARLFRSASTEELSRRGFGYLDATGLPAFHGPDLPYLTSTEFLNDHCFSVVDGRDETAGLIGLAFEPRDGRAVTDIAGVMWLDRDLAELRFIDFAFRGGAATAGSAGRIAFEQLASGVWIVRDWSMRTPVLTQAGQMLGFREEAGEALQVSASMLAIADSIANSRRPPGRVNGVVMDSLLTRPLAGAIVTIDSAGPSARTDSSGTYWIRSVPAGTRRISVRHPLLDSIGTIAPTRTIRVGPDSTTHVNLGGPSLPTLKGGACHDSLAVLTGLVRDVATGAPIDTAAVSLSWIEIVFIPGQPLAVFPVDVVVPTDETGRYAACVPPRLEVTLSAEQGGARTGRVDVRPDDRKLSVVYLALDRTTTDTLTGSAAIQGIVMYQDRTPIPNATVMLTDPERSVVTDSVGRFRIASIPGGTRALDTRALGHAPVRTVVDARVGDTTTTRIYMRKVTQLDAIVVRAIAGSGSRAIVELEERRRKGEGYRLTPVELLGFRHSRMDAVARALPFTTVRWSQGSARILLNTTGGRWCEPNVWIDGRRNGAEMLSDFPASEVLAVEFFRRASETPLKYRAGNECGAILLWTREAAKGD